MKRLLDIFCAAALLLLASCGGRSATSCDDFTVEVYTPSYASGFEIVGAEGASSTIVRVRDPWQGAEGVETMLFIARNGEQAPEGFEGQIIEGDAQRVVCMSSTHIAMLDAVGAVSTVVGGSGLDYVSNGYVASHRDSIGDVGYDGNIDYEMLVALDPDLVLVFGVNGTSGMEPKLRELGIPFCYVGEYVEESPSGKAEWMVAVAEAVGRRAEAVRVFAAIPERYEALCRSVAASGEARPKVMINTPYGDSWFMASTESYVARLIADAGGDYIYKKNSGTTSLPIDLEEAVVLASAADVWINASVPSLADLKRLYPKFADAGCVVRGDVYNNDRRTSAVGGNDYWESGVVHPDLVLRDLVKIFHPELVGEEPFVYYRKLE